MESESVNKQIGDRLKNLRQQNGLTQQELADRCELTKGFISQLERGQVSPSVVTLLDLIECLGVTPSKFFEDKAGEQVVFRNQDFFEKVDEDGNVIEWIVPNAQGRQMEPLLVTIQPHSRLEVDAPHSGEEFGYVLGGRVTLHIGERKMDVKAGESFYYPADKCHWLENTGNRAAKLMWVSTPPNF